MDGIEKLRKKVRDFNFINEGFNLRPLVSASIGMNQFKDWIK